MVFIAKVLLAALVIAFASWLSVKKPILAGFIIALPLLSILSIAFSYAEHKNLDKTILFAKSIVIGIPLGIYCARRQRFYSMIRPIMDFM